MLYEYKCNSCNTISEIEQKISEDKLTECPICDSSDFTRLISAPAVHFKGTGWYKTDFKNNTTKNNKKD